MLPQYSQSSLASRTPPPLKLIFVMDNSNSMTLNNLNLKESFASMFADNANSLSQFDIDISFITTAQLPALGGNFLGQMASLDDLVRLSPSDIQSKYRDSGIFGGKIPGDLLGFRLNNVRKENVVRREFLPQSVLKFDSPAGSILPASSGSQSMPVIQFRRGQSLEALKAQVAERLNIISPALASGITNPDVFPVVDKSSGLCAIGRVLKNSKQFLSKGDIVSFVLVSDADDFSARDGSECIDAYQYDYTYNAVCSKPIPATTVKQTRIDYLSSGTPSSTTTNFSLTPFDQVKKKVITTMKLIRNAKAASCGGEQEREFVANYDLITKTYSITYSKKPQIGTREGNIPIYGEWQTGLTASGFAGEVPADCSTNLAPLKTKLSDSTSILAITTCTQNANTSAASSKTLLYADYNSIDLTVSIACNSAILSAINPSGSLTISNCKLAKKIEPIPAASLAAEGFSSNSDLASCQNAVRQVCSNSSGKLRGCAQKTFTAAVSAALQGPISVTSNYFLGCSSTCATFPGLCDKDDGRTISSYASSQLLTCSPSTVYSTDTFLEPQNPRNQSVVAATELNCSSACSLASSACGGDNSAGKTIAMANKACTVTSATVTNAIAPAPMSTSTVDDNMEAINCNTACSASNGICTGTQTISQYITNSSGQASTCTVMHPSARNIAASEIRQTLSKIKKTAADARNYCPEGYSPVGDPILSTTDYDQSIQLVQGTSQNMKEFILSQMKSEIGERAGTISAFITGESDGDPSRAISYGAQYEDLVKSWGHGAINDVHSPSYTPALATLGNTLHDQLIRTITFPDVKGDVRIRKVWIRSQSTLEWGEPIDPNLWSATGPSLTLDAQVPVNQDDFVKIQYY